ncbi:hypothetical protein CWR45_12395 [Oceanobacillus chungangensis]|uniref:Methyltransferase type 11 domain-containing protein n=1 Tax=Oceanobacillus chungangensis TaxID=1229152 RepID=A0A3D8PMU9_9BACI|nr:hypothetical protein [Oceanobacillus chungangensis]RDW17420.1 hypothetical protein CWR45_12395 [Oceanobacillus chungangensis]
MLLPLPRSIVATEAYVPNVTIAKARLEPLRVKVIQIEDDEDTNHPFEDGQFDLIINRHEYYPPKENNLCNGLFITQQVGGLDCS